MKSAFDNHNTKKEFYCLYHFCVVCEYDTFFNGLHSYQLNLFLDCISICFCAYTQIILQLTNFEWKMAEQQKFSSSHSDHSTDNKHRFQVSSSSQLFRPFFPIPDSVAIHNPNLTKSSLPFFLFHFTLFPSKNKKHLTYYKTHSPLHSLLSSFSVPFTSCPW